MALFNNSFPATYNPYYQQAYNTVGVPSQSSNQQQTGSSIIWVQGEAGAKSYLVAPNANVALWDSEEPVIYIKSADASGMPSIKTLDYTVRSPESDFKASKADAGKFISKDDFEALEKRVRTLSDTVDKMKHSKVKITRMSEEGEDE